MKRDSSSLTIWWRTMTGCLRRLFTTGFICSSGRRSIRLSGKPRKKNWKIGTTQTQFVGTSKPNRNVSKLYLYRLRWDKTTTQKRDDEWRWPFIRASMSPYPVMNFDLPVYRLSVIDFLQNCWIFLSKVHCPPLFFSVDFTRGWKCNRNPSMLDQIPIYSRIKISIYNTKTISNSVIPSP